MTTNCSDQCLDKCPDCATIDYKLMIQSPETQCILTHVQKNEYLLFSAILIERARELFPILVQKETNHPTLPTFSTKYIDQKVNALSSHLLPLQDVVDTASIAFNNAVKAYNRPFLEEIAILELMKTIDIPRYLNIVFITVPTLYEAEHPPIPSSYFNTIDNALAEAGTCDISKLQQLVTDLETCIALPIPPYTFELNVFPNINIDFQYIVNIKKFLTLMYMIQNGIVDNAITATTPPGNYVLPPLHRSIINDQLAAILNPFPLAYFYDKNKTRTMGLNNWVTVSPDTDNIDSNPQTTSAKSYALFYDKYNFVQYIIQEILPTSATTNPKTTANTSGNNVNYYGAPGVLAPGQIRFSILEYLFILGRCYGTGIVTGAPTSLGAIDNMRPIPAPDPDTNLPATGTVLHTLIAKMKSKTKLAGTPTMTTVTNGVTKTVSGSSILYTIP